MLTTVCESGFYSRTKVVCNLWDPWNPMNQPPTSHAGTIAAHHGEFASHYSPASARCELLLANAGHYEFRSTHAHIDAKSSLLFFACASPDRCESRPVIQWSGIAWNVAELPIGKPYIFTATVAQYLKIVLEVAATPVASNTFTLRWDLVQSNNQSVCLPCPPAHEEDDDVWAPYVENEGCLGEKSLVVVM